MELYEVVLFTHIAVVLAAFALTGAIHVSEWLTVRASTVQEMRILSKPMAWGVLFAPVVALLLFLGAWLVQLSDDRAAAEYSFSDGWVWTAAVVLAFAFVAGFALEGPAAQRLGKALAEAPDGPATAELRAQASEPLPWLVGHAVPFMIVGVVSNMVNKPGTAVSLLVIAVGAMVGLLLGWLGLRQARALAPGAATS
ncbi:MAG TPA: hypothetical protein VMZ11_01050 [Mycobacteriales bacterium]|nr:hypothetical protein [Mycobacteriales bacterium]